MYSRLNARIKEVPIFFDRTIGESKMSSILCMKQHGWSGDFVFGNYLVDLNENLISFCIGLKCKKSFNKLSKSISMFKSVDPLK